MINADNIGKRIRMLRKQKHISQERMAEDLGMYQADISNLERAVSGSGIMDLFKLDRIAEYFGIPLVELLSGVKGNPATNVSVSENNKSEEDSIKDHIIKDVRYGFSEDAFVSEITLTAPDRRVFYVSFSEYDDEPRFYKTDESIFEKLLTKRGETKQEKKLNKNCFLSGDDYIDIFSNVEPKWIEVCRYLVFVATEDEDAVVSLINETKDKSFREIEVPVPEREPEDLFYVNYSDLSVVYRYRLMVEATLKNPSVFCDLDNTEKREKAILEKLKAACASEEAYKVWKKDLVNAKIQEVLEKQKIVTCTYVFAGIGQYKEIMPEEMVPSFICWINANGSAIYCGSQPATKREIRTYVSQHIADDLLY